MPRGARASKLETDKRIFTIQGWITSGVPDYLILKNIEQQFKDKNGIHVGRRQAKNLIEKAYKIWHENESGTTEQKRTLRIAELKQDIRGMKDEFKGTPKGMTIVNQIKKEISKLEALYPMRSLTLRGDRENPVVVVEEWTEDKERRIQQLKEKLLGTNQD